MKVSHKGSRIMVLALCMMMVLAVAAPAMAAKALGYATVTAETATVYSSPTKATVLGVFKKNDVVEVVSASSDGTLWGVNTSAGSTSVGYIEKAATNRTGGSVSGSTGGKAVAAMTAASGAAAAATQTMGVIYNVKTDVNFRETASASGKLLGKLKLNQEVAVLGESNGFYQLTANGQTGYVSKAYVRITSQATTQTPVVATPGEEAIAAQGLMKSSSTRAYKEADSKSGSAGTIAARAIVDISGQSGDYYKVTSGKITGYVTKSAVTVLPTVSGASGTVTANAAAKLYEAASTSSKSLTSVTKGKTATVSGETSSFYKVTYSNRTGFVEKSKVTLQGGSSSTSGGVQGTSAPSTGGTGKVTLGTGKIRVQPSVSLSATSASAMAAAKKINSDVMGYLNVPGTNIQQPILYNYGNLGGDPHYYANHTIEKKSATKGAIYTYYKSLARNNVVNGHNMRGSNDMTHQLHHLQEKALGYTTCQTTDNGGCKAASLANTPDLRTNANARVFEISLHGYTRWEVYAMYETPATEPKTTLNNNIDHLGNKTPAQVKTWIEGQIARSEVKFNVDVSTDDVLMTLYTCGTNYDYSTAQSRLYFFLKAIG